MSEEQSKRRDAISELIESAEEEQTREHIEEERKTEELAASASSAQSVGDNSENSADGEKASADGGKGVFKKYKIRDIVFLAVITACTLVTGAIMPLLVNVPLFGIIQLGLGLQFSLFPVIGIMKVRKPFALILQSVFISVFLVFMFPPMVLITVCALFAEALALLIFRGYKNDWACVFAGTLYMPLTIPLLYMYYNVFYSVSGTEKAAVSMFIGGGNAGVIAGITVAVIAVCFIGSLIGMIIARELKKAGKLK